MLYKNPWHSTTTHTKIVINRIVILGTVLILADNTHRQQDYHSPPPINGKG